MDILCYWAPRLTTAIGYDVIDWCWHTKLAAFIFGASATACYHVVDVLPASSRCHVVELFTVMAILACRLQYGE